MSNYKEVSLGFAEFVSQLLQETFDSALSVQSHQLETYSELEKIVEMSNEQFKALYIDDEDIENKEREIFHQPLKQDMKASASFETLVYNIVGEANLINQKKLTSTGYEILNEYVLDQLVLEKKNILNSLINKANMTQLVIESGEIKAKLELTNLYLSPSETNEESNIKASSRKKMEVKPLSLQLGKTKLSKQQVKLTEVIDKKTKQSTLIIDKSSLKSAMGSLQTSPLIRVIAKPVSSNNTSSLYSEVTIRFKTI